MRSRGRAAARTARIALVAMTYPRCTRGPERLERVIACCTSTFASARAVLYARRNECKSTFRSRADRKDGARASCLRPSCPSRFAVPVSLFGVAGMRSSRSASGQSMNRVNSSSVRISENRNWSPCTTATASVCAVRFGEADGGEPEPIPQMLRNSLKAGTARFVNDSRKNTIGKCAGAFG